mgnify:CR=1 FL=1
MAIKDIIPWNWGRRSELLGREEGANPFSLLQRRMNSLFEDFMSGFGFEPVGTRGFTPRVNVSEDEKNLYVEAELPGMSDKDIEVTLTKDALTLRGEKKQEHEHKEGSLYHAERSYGYFQRVIPLSCEIDEDKVDAVFKNGVLNITLGKSAAAQKSFKKIPIRQ